MSTIHNLFEEIGPLTNWENVYEAYANFRKETKEEVTKGNSLWVFRGQGNAEWHLQTTLERKINPQLEQEPCCEEGLVREFQRRLSTFDDSIQLPDKDNILEWLALMQHHGAPTRLLDWTYSFFVALFFAVESCQSGKPAAVWAVDARWCNRQSRQRLPGSAEMWEKKVAKDPFFTRPSSFRALFARKRPVPLVYRVNPLVMNTRLSIQQGLFLCPGDGSMAFEDNLAALSDGGAEKPLRKWIIDGSAAAEILENLGYMNIGRHSLFPGIDGFAQSLGQLLNRPNWLVPSWRKKRGRQPFARWNQWD